MASISASNRLERQLNQVSPQPAGPSHKKPFTILLPLVDPFYNSTLQTLITLIGTGVVFGDDQPINFRFLIDPSSQPSATTTTTTTSPPSLLSPESLLYISNGFSIPNTIRIYSILDEIDQSTTDINFLIFPTQHSTLSPPSTTNVTPPTSLIPSTTLFNSIATSLSAHQQQRAQQPQNVLAIRPKVLLIGPHLPTLCRQFQRLSQLPPDAIHGFVYHYQALFLSKLVNDINQEIYLQKSEAKFPYLTVQSITNCVIRSSSLVDDNDIIYNISHAVLANYPIEGRVTPLSAVTEQFVKKRHFFKTQARWTPPSMNQMFNPKIENQNENGKNTLPLTPIPSLIAQHLRNWFNFTQRGVYFPSCIAVYVKKEADGTTEAYYQIQPISTYYGNTSTSITFEP